MRALGDHPLLHGASAEALDQLAGRLTAVVAAAGSVLMREGEPGSTFLLLEEGRVSIRRRDREDRELAVLGPGALVGELSVLRQSPRTATAVALDEVRGYCGDHEALLSLFAAAPGAAAAVATLAAGRLAGFVSPVRATLRSGLRLHIRPILPSDRAKAAEAIAELSDRSRYLRFFTAGGVPEPVLDQLVNIDYRNHFAWVALEADEPGNPYLGSCRFIRRIEEPDVADVAFGVADRHQGEGLGRLLMGALIVAAHVQRVHRFRADVMADNRPMLALLRQAGAQHWEPGPVMTTTFDLPPAGTLLPPGPCAEDLRRAAEMVASAAAAVGL